MKVLLIQPPIRDFYQTSIRTQPIGLAYLAASLKGHGHEVEILDCQTEKRKSIPIPRELSYLREFYPFNDRSPFKLYTGFYHFGMDWEGIRQKLITSSADVFGISSSFTPYHGEALDIARIVKEWDCAKVVVMGGAHVSSDPVGVLKSSYVDYVILGEGEIRFPLLLETIEKKSVERISKLDGIGYRKDGKIEINPIREFIQDLDGLPFPARDALQLDRYRIRKKRSTMLITSRGCPHRCAYCSGHLVMGNAFRTRSPESIIREMKQCEEKFRIEAFDVEDDNFTFDQERAKKWLELVIESFQEGTLELSAMNGVSFASLDENLLRLMKRAGFHTLNLSFVSTETPTKERMKRPKTAVEFDRILEEASRLGLHVIAYGIFGMPGQSIEEMVETLVYLMGRTVLIGPSIYYPTPGTSLFEKCKKERSLPLYLSQWRSSAFPVETQEFNRLDLVTLFRLTRVINFIKDKMVQGELDAGITWRELFRVLPEKVEAQDKLHEVISWEELLLSLIHEGSFFSLRENAEGRVTATREKTSRRVLDYFLEKAWDRPIMKN